MARRVKFDRESIIRAALDIVREGGPEALNARAVAARLGSSTQPLYSGLGSMESCGRRYTPVRRRCSTSGWPTAAAEDVPCYKACGLTLLRFANEERALYRLLFLSDCARGQCQKSLEETAAARMRPP